MHNGLQSYLSLFVSRHSDFALQRSDGSYVRAGRSLFPVEVRKHLMGEQTIGGYLISEQGTCITAVFDADMDDDRLAILHTLQTRLALAGIASYPEASRRGWHLWVFLAKAVPASHVRLWLLPYCPAGVEFYPKQDEGKGYGSLIRLPFGVHQRSGKRYPFVEASADSFVPVATSLRSALEWLSTVQRVHPPLRETLTPTGTQSQTHNKETSFSYPPISKNASNTIREWCAQQDPLTLIGRYVQLTSQGVGCCPFGEHHAHGVDRHASFKVYAPGVHGGYCWYCHTWQQGGSVFDFLRYYRNMDARALWQTIKEGGAA